MSTFKYNIMRKLRLQAHVICRMYSKIEQKTLLNESKTIHQELTKYKNVMSHVPLSVVVVTTSTSAGFKRGITCGSFTGVSLNPPIVSFSMNKYSRMHKVIHKRREFVINILSCDQVKYGVHFAQPAIDDQDQFLNIPHSLSSKGLPVIEGVNAVLHCKGHSVHTVGDHHIWYGEVEDCQSHCGGQQPLLYYARSYRTISDDMFMQAFEDKSLLFEDWTHVAHIRMAWNYIKLNGREKATPLIISGIKEYNEQNKEKITRGYHETVTHFYIHMVSQALDKFGDKESSFKTFLEVNNHLLDRQLLFKYYSENILQKPEAKTSFFLPDKMSLP